MKKIIPDKNGCWNWTGRINRAGYGDISIKVRGGKHVMMLAHRVSYQLLRGTIKEGYQIDHLCRNRKCINPEHLEPVTPKTNVIRGNSVGPKPERRIRTCKWGHDFSGDNIYEYIGRRGVKNRGCVICRRERARKFYQ